MRRAQSQGPATATDVAAIRRDQGQGPRPMSQHLSAILPSSINSLMTKSPLMSPSNRHCEHDTWNVPQYGSGSPGYSIQNSVSGPVNSCGRKPSRQSRSINTGSGQITGQVGGDSGFNVPVYGIFWGEVHDVSDAVKQLVLLGNKQARLSAVAGRRRGWTPPGLAKRATWYGNLHRDPGRLRLSASRYDAPHVEEPSSLRRLPAFLAQTSSVMDS